MKVDKDAILKHKFWILLGVFALLWLICLSVLCASAGAPVDEAKKDFDAAKTAVSKFTGANRPKNDSFLPPWQADIKQFEQHKNTVWRTAWDGDQEGDTPPGQQRWEGQKGMYTWPSSDDYPLNAVLKYPDQMKSDGTTPVLNTASREWFKTKAGYASQFDDLAKELIGDRERPDPNAPLGVVAFKGGFDAIMQPIDWEKSSRPPDIEECWLAQEDFWVKRELLYSVRDALALAARMDPVDGEFEKTPLPGGKLARHVFRNASWEVQLLFDKGPNGIRISPDSSIKNVHVSHRDQDLGSARNPTGVWFRLKQNGAPVRSFAVVGEKVAWQQERKFGDDAKAKDGIDVNVSDPKQPMELEQIFDPTNVPVVAVDEIKIPYLSHRNADRPLIPTKPDRYGKKDVPAADAAKTPTPGAPAMPTGPGAPPVGSGGSTPPGFGSASGPNGLTGQPGGAEKADMTANGFFDRDRYLFVTEQSRHLPLAMTLTIDQSHLGEILVAAANSRLRFQTTQVEFRRVHGSGQGGSSTPPGGYRPPSMPAASPGGSGASMRPPRTSVGPVGPGETPGAPPRRRWTSTTRT